MNISKIKTFLKVITVLSIVVLITQPLISSKLLVDHHGDEGLLLSPEDYRIIPVSFYTKSNNNLINFIPDVNQIIETDGEIIKDFVPVKQHEVIVKSGDNFISIVNKFNIHPKDVKEIIYKTKNGKQISRLNVGDKIELTIFKDGQFNKIKELKLWFSKDEFYHLSYENGQPKIERRIAESTSVVAHAVGEIDKSLYHAGLKSGLSPKTISDLVDIFSWKVNLSRTIQKGDKFFVIYERNVVNGTYVGDGKILAARIVNNGRNYEAFYNETDSNSGYYDAEGNNLSRSFSKKPVKNPVVTSRFNLNRLHPILKVRRPHKGVDFRGRTGDPILATGDGKIHFAGYYGGYGHAVIINHGNGYKSLYAHMSKIPKGIKKGIEVKKGDKIGYVGSTGRSTGPHLHYEFRVNNKPVDPLKFKYPSAEPIKSREFSDYKDLQMANINMLQEKLLQGEYYQSIALLSEK